MGEPLIVFIPEKERETLKHGGVLPPGWFRDALGMPATQEASERVWMWTCDAKSTGEDEDGDIPSHPGRLLGLPCTTDAERRLAERRVAKLFGAWVVHVVFLDGAGNGAAGTVGIRPLLERAAWAKRLEKSIRTWFAEEQVRNIRHLAVLVARGGPVECSAKDFEELEAAIGTDGTFRAVYFANHLIETELGRDALHSACLWPVLTGRLLLRFLISLSKANPAEEDIFKEGVHLWKSGELLFGYPMGALAEQLSVKLPELYGKLASQATGAGASAANPSARKLTVFPDLPSELSGFAKNVMEDWAGQDWHSGSVQDMAEQCVDEKRWEKAMEKARVDFVARNCLEFRGEGVFDCEFSPFNTFTQVDGDPRQIQTELDRVAAVADGGSVGDAYVAWKAVVDAEAERRNAGAKLRSVAGELAKAQAHFVTAPYGFAAAVAVSMACGYAVFGVLWALGGNAGLPLALGCAALAVAGAFAARWAMARVHRDAGQAAYHAFLETAKEADAAMDKRHAAAVETVRTAETTHRSLLREASRKTLARLLERIGRIVVHELESPPLEATWRSDEMSPEEAGGENGNSRREARDEIETYLGETRWTEDLTANDTTGNSGNKVDAIIQEVAADDGKESFRTFWQDLCNRVDGPRQGNLPATVVIPEIRHWLERCVGRILDAQQLDFRERELGGNRGAARFLPRDGYRRVENEGSFTWASAHVDNPECQTSSEHLYFFSKRHPGDRAAPPGIEFARPITVTEVPGMSGLLQTALYWMDIRLFGFARTKTGRLAFRKGEERS